MRGKKKRNRSVYSDTIPTIAAMATAIATPMEPAALVEEDPLTNPVVLPEEALESTQVVQSVVATELVAGRARSFDATFESSLFDAAVVSSVDAPTSAKENVEADESS
jgi:hypothetical protein